MCNSNTPAMKDRPWQYPTYSNNNTLDIYAQGGNGLNPNRHLMVQFSQLTEEKMVKEEESQRDNMNDTSGSSSE